MRAARAQALNVGAEIARTFRRGVASRLFRSVVVGGMMTLGVKAVAFVKELTVAHQFGTSSEVDAFLVAALIPTIVAVIVGDAFRDAAIPEYSERRIENDPAASRLISNVLWISAAVLVLVSLTAWLLNRHLIQLLAGDGFPPQKVERAAEFLRMLFPFAICMGMASLLKGYLQAHHRFAVSSLAPALVPLSTILLLFLWPGEASGHLLAAGFSIGAVGLFVFLAFQAHGLHEREGLLAWPRWDATTRAVMKSAVPIMAGAAVMEGCFFVDTMMAASLPDGSVAVLNYGERICTIVLAIGGTACGQALFPHVSDLAARKEWRRMLRDVYRFSGIVLIVTIPCILVFWTCSHFIVRLLLERGEFTPDDTDRVAEVVQFASLQIPGYILAVLGARVVIALRAGPFMLVTTGCALAINVGLNLVFMRWFGVKGIALSTAIVALFTAAALFVFFTLRARRLARLQDEAASEAQG